MKKNGSVLIRLMSLTFVLIFIAPVMIYAQAVKANFSGSWTLNESKSTMPEGGGGGGRMGGRNFTITQDANLMTRTSTTQDGTQRVAKYTLDGKESINTMGERESKSTAKWSADGKSLTIVTKLNYDGNERTTTSVWSMADAKTLSVVNTGKNRDGADYTLKMIYDKK